MCHVVVFHLAACILYMQVIYFCMFHRHLFIQAVLQNSRYDDSEVKHVDININASMNEWVNELSTLVIRAEHPYIAF